MALIAGIQAPLGRVMGHSGAFVGAGEKKAIGKVRALEDAGVVITNHPSRFGEEMKRLLGSEAYRTFLVSDIRDQLLKYPSRSFVGRGSHHRHTTSPSNEICTLFGGLLCSLRKTALCSSGVICTFWNLRA